CSAVGAFLSIGLISRNSSLFLRGPLLGSSPRERTRSIPICLDRTGLPARKRAFSFGTPECYLSFHLTSMSQR
ncbi:hypothetical protein NXX25_20935, partial [Bacteroides fragilis]|nr:hypothetical protein [Bacteroides fragilis]